jgi:type I restriction-modification system DNA methylase subunit
LKDGTNWRNRKRSSSLQTPMGTNRTGSTKPKNPMPPQSKPQIPQSVLALVERFERNHDAYRSPNYNETQVRREFIDPLFKALGWDIDNEQGYAETYKDVIHEDAIKVGEATKAPDYCFRVGGTRKFFVEAKKPAVNIKNDINPAFQIRRYAWTTKLPLSIVSNFAEFVVYDCRVKPDQKDKASVARILDIPYTEYSTRWHEIADVFSRDAVLKGSFDKYAETNKGKRGTAEVDDEFLQTIESWRKDLAENLALRNKKLSQRELNFAVQRIIDRIIFLRISEGRGLEEYGRLRALSEKNSIYPRLGNLFRQADDRYNSGLFHFKVEKGRHESPDDFTLDLALDDNLLRRILTSLYYPESPYVFSALPADMLGQVYEQFLGKVIRLTAGHHAKVEDKPEVKKAGGVYYTPTYIVEYIVENTVGQLLEGKTVKQVATLKILDPACGSGSFLLGAYECVLKWYLDFYVGNNPTKWARGNKPTLVQVSGGGWRLTIAERKRILIDNIYGVDIDSQAVETTKLSLLLKVLEGETSQTVQLELLHERALPDLGDNIKCGNSLIAPDFYQQQQISLFDHEERYRINVFDWKSEFPDIAKTGGFDAVIGNPPWGALLSEAELEYLRRHNRNIIVRMVDSFMYFVYQGSGKLNAHGYFGMILPDVVLYQTDTQKLREWILNEFTIHRILNMGDVFKKVTRPSSILIFQSGRPAHQVIEVADFSHVGKFEKASKMADQSQFSSVMQDKLLSVPGSLFVTANIAHYSIWTKISGVQHKKLEELVDEDGIQRGVSPDLKEAFLVDAKTAKQERLETHALRKVVTGGRQVKRYFIDYPDLLLIYTRRDTNVRELPNIRAYIDQFKDQITCKEVKQHKHSIYALHRARNENIFIKRKKLLGVITEDEIVIALDERLTFATDGLYVFGLREDVSTQYVMGILNSRLFVFIYRLLALESGRVLAQVKPTVLAQLPIRAIDLGNRQDKAQYDRVIQHVDDRLALHKQLAIAKTPQEKSSLERQITANDAQINGLVYCIYSLTSEEIQTVEGASGF